MQGKVELAEALGTTGVVRGEWREEKLEEESCWKSGGGRTRLYTWQRVGLADEAQVRSHTGHGGR